MLHKSCWAMACLCLIGSVGLSAPTPRDTTKKTTAVEDIRKALDNELNMEFDNQALSTVLNDLTTASKVKFSVDNTILAMVGLTPETLNVSYKAKDVKLAVGLRKMLQQYQLSYAIVGDSVFISTEEGVTYRQLRQRIDVNVDNTPIQKILKDLSNSTGATIILDPRVIKAKGNETPVTLQVDDIPLDSAVRLVSELASLKPVRIGNVLFVTTEDRADKLAKDPELPPPGPPNIFPQPGPFGGGNDPRVIPENRLDPPVQVQPANPAPNSTEPSAPQKR
jgi:type II secretory pathway component GspD/PulD (secretin)